MKVIERFAATVQGVSTSLQMGVAEGPTSGQVEDVFQVVSVPESQDSEFTRDDFWAALEAASSDPSIPPAMFAKGNPTEFDEDEDWRPLNEE